MLSSSIRRIATSLCRFSSRTTLNPGPTSIVQIPGLPMPVRATRGAQKLPLVPSRLQQRLRHKDQHQRGHLKPVRRRAAKTIFPLSPSFTFLLSIESQTCRHVFYVWDCRWLSEDQSKTWLRLNRNDEKHRISFFRVTLRRGYVVSCQIACTRDRQRDYTLKPDFHGQLGTPAPSPIVQIPGFLRPVRSSWSAQ